MLHVANTESSAPALGRALDIFTFALALVVGLLLIVLPLPVYFSILGAAILAVLGIVVAITATRKLVKR